MAVSRVYLSVLFRFSLVFNVPVNLKKIQIVSIEGLRFQFSHRTHHQNDPVSRFLCVVKRKRLDS